MKIYRNKRTANTTIRMIKNDEGKPVALFGTVEDLLLARLITDSAYDAWHWLIILVDTLDDDGYGDGEAFDTREELIAWAKEHFAA